MRITLKDGSCKEYGQAMSIYDIALDISEGLARMACAGQGGFADSDRQRLSFEYSHGQRPGGVKSRQTYRIPCVGGGCEAFVPGGEGDHWTGHRGWFLL